MNHVKAYQGISKAVMLVFVFLSLCSLCSCGLLFDEFKTPPEPEIRYGEFPFTVVYEKNGKIITYKDTIICEYAGIMWNHSAMKKGRKWNRYYASGHDMVLLERDDGSCLKYLVGSNATYLMGDKESSYYEYLENAFCIISIGESGQEVYSWPSREEVYEQYGIKIISYDIAPPIENSFK